MGRNKKKATGSGSGGVGRVANGATKKAEAAAQTPPPPSVASSDDETEDNGSNGSSGGGGGGLGEPAPAKNDADAATIRRRRPPAALLTTLRLILLDLPLALLFLLLVSTTTLVQIKDLYLLPQLNAMKWTKSRKRTELTYYDRRCNSVEEMSTQSVADLVIGENYTKEDCVEHMMVHGASMYRNILSPKTADKLREFVLRRNGEITKEEQIYVIGNKHRWSFGVGANEDPIVPVALREIATNAQLRGALEGIAGDDPALIEMTAITSAYRAEDQFWHTDTLPKGNSLKFARSFVPSYSLFIPLQDTTAEMGATEICPGTHICHNGDAEDVCAEHGFQVSGPPGSGGKWRRGDGVLSNQHTYHRGTAHVDRHGKHRVLFILTFAPRPAERAESRMIGQGGSYSLRWDMWGHTLRDLEDATRRMAQPWATLRSLGAYKHEFAHWGWDFVRVVSMRIINSDVGYDDDGDFKKFLKRGGLQFLPKFITRDCSREGWAEYLEDALERSKDCLFTANIVALLVYLVAVISVTLLRCIRHRSKSPANDERQHRFTFIRGALTRLFLSHGTIALVGYLTLRHVSSTAWATDIKLGRHQTSAFSGIKADVKALKALSMPPLKTDILFGIRHDGENYGSINRQLDYHPGNREFRAAVSDFTGTRQPNSPSFRDLPSAVQNHVVTTILAEMKRDGRRFLMQNDAGYWAEMPAKKARKFALRALLKSDNDLLQALDTKIALMLAKARYGETRSTALGQRFAPRALDDWRQKLFSLEGFDSNPPSTAAIKLCRPFAPTETEEPLRREGTYWFRASSPGSSPLHASALPHLAMKVSSHHPPHIIVSDARSNFCQRKVQSTADDQPVNDIPQVGDVVWAQWKGKFNEWYKGFVEKVTEREGTQDLVFDVVFDDGDRNRALPQRALRKYTPLQLEDVVEATEPGTKDTWIRAVVKYVGEDGTYGLKFSNGKRGRLASTGIRRFSWFFEEGDEVLCKFHNQGSEWYPGVISRVRTDGTCDVDYDDGDKDGSLPPEAIRLSWTMDP